MFSIEYGEKIFFIKNVFFILLSFLQLRRDLANKQAELDTLLHEKQTIWEQQAGAAAHHDRELIGKCSNMSSLLNKFCRDTTFLR